MQRLAGRTIGLDGVVAQEESYRRSGFELAWNNVRYEGLARPRSGLDGAIEQVDPGRVETSGLLAYDAAFFPDDRRRFVRRWVAQPRSTALMIRRDAQVAGYGVIRPCRVGFKVGPLFANDAESADRLLRALISRAEPGGPVQLDIPAVNSAALELVQAHAMRPVFRTARMLRRSGARSAARKDVRDHHVRTRVTQRRAGWRRRRNPPWPRLRAVWISSADVPSGPTRPARSSQSAIGTWTCARPRRDVDAERATRSLRWPAERVRPGTIADSEVTSLIAAGRDVLRNSTEFKG